MNTSVFTGTFSSTAAALQWLVLRSDTSSLQSSVCQIKFSFDLMPRASHKSDANASEFSVQFRCREANSGIQPVIFRGMSSRLQGGSFQTRELPRT